MQQPYFIVVLAHSLHGRLRRIHIPYHAVYAVLVLALIGSFSVFGFAFSYFRMALKVASYNSLRAEVETVRERYQRLEKTATQQNQQLASLQLLASEVSIAYGIKRHLEGPSDIAGEGRLVPTLKETLEEYDFLRSARIRPMSRRPTMVYTHPRPSIWPVEGRLLSHFGGRTDPFNGMGAFHSGVDISAAMGTPVKVAADGVVAFVGYSGGYGRLVVVEHPNGIQTYYAHLLRADVIPGQEVRMGETVARSGASGRATSPHLHYEVRLHGGPLNPYSYLNMGAQSLAKAAQKDFPF